MSRRLIFILIFLLSFTVINVLTKKEPTSKDELKTRNIGIITEQISYKRGKEVILILRNNTTENIEIPINCPYPPVTIKRYQDSNWIDVKAKAELSCDEQEKNITLVPNTDTRLSLKNWTYELFSETGRYQAELDLRLEDKPKTITSNEFVIEKESVMGLIWREGLYRPIYNTLIFMITKVGGHNLGIGIILLTILIRSILIIPSQRALKSQKKLQEIQPKLEAIKKKYKDNQERIAQETLKLWRENKVNPLGSCLPLLLQLPILIALYYVISDGLSPSNVHLLYEPLKNIKLADINIHFLGLNLTAINIFVLPLIVGILQFLQIKLQLERKKVKGEPSKTPNEMAIMNKSMLYVMPVMIALFTASVPAGVGLYWAASTLYGIGQQIVVNLQHQTTN